MRFKRVVLDTGEYTTAMWCANSDCWVPLPHAAKLLGLTPVDLLGSALAVGDKDCYRINVLCCLQAHNKGEKALLHLAESSQLASEAVDLQSHITQHTTLLPFTPASLRDSSLSLKHNLQSAAGFVNTFMPIPIRAAMYSWNFLVGWYTGWAFPPLYPAKIFYERPLFYTGNHLNAYTLGDIIPVPEYAQQYLDYELEVAFVVGEPGRNFTACAAQHAIGGYLLINDFTARSIQMAEMRSGFGINKTKSFATSYGDVVVTPDEIGDVGDLQGVVKVNGETTGRGRMAPMQFSPQEVLAYCSEGENMFPGLGTLAGCAGIEVGQRLLDQDEIALEMEPFGVLKNTVSYEHTPSRWQDKNDNNHDSVSRRALLEQQCHHV